MYETIPAAIEQGVHVADSIIKTDPDRYTGTTLSHTLQVAGLSVTSLGVVNPEDSSHDVFTKTDYKRGIYKKLVLKDGILIGAIILRSKKTVTRIRAMMNQAVTSKMIQDLLS